MSYTSIDMRFEEGSNSVQNIELRAGFWQPQKISLQV